MLQARRLEHDPGAAGVGHQGYGVAVFEVVDKNAQSALGQTELVGRLHGPRNIGQEHQVGILALAQGQLLGLYADAENMAVGSEGRWRRVHVYSKWLVALGGSVVVTEIIDEFFDSNGVGRRHLAGHDFATGEGV